jgi:hypothetical protein
MKLSDITISHEGIDWQKCLQHWAWILKRMPEFSIWLVTKFGEIFVVSDDEEIWFLSTSNASYEKIADSKEEFASLVDDPENIEYFFMPGVIGKLEESGMLLKAKECYGFHVPMVFKEATLEASNFKTIGVEPYLIGLGDLLGQLRNTENGEKVTFNVVS